MWIGTTLHHVQTSSMSELEMAKTRDLMIFLTGRFLSKESYDVKQQVSPLLPRKGIDPRFLNNNSRLWNFLSYRVCCNNTAVRYRCPFYFERFVSTPYISVRKPNIHEEKKIILHSLHYGLSPIMCFREISRLSFDIIIISSLFSLYLLYEILFPCML